MEILKQNGYHSFRDISTSTLESLREHLPSLQLAPSFVSEAEGSQSPGQLVKHYSPRARVLLFRGEDSARVIARMQAMLDEAQADGVKAAVLVSDEDAESFATESVCRLGPAEDLAAIG